ncbi:RNA polymerase sigma factor SigE [Arthrobacter sp. A5]|uniref:RNA polymerase sigma factor SigE n=1 Tax=Arthrobacter sp. A5 TaxID=576926 RepID=UPI003DA97829
MSASAAAAKHGPVLPVPPSGSSAGSGSAEQPTETEWEVPSWEDVVTNHSAKVFRLAYRLTGNRYDAEDLTQEVFVRVFRSLANFKPGTMDGWLHRITTNLFLDQARRKSRIRFDALADDADARLPGKDPGPERIFEYNNLDIDVQAALEALPPDFRAAVVLCDLEGLSYDEVAEALGIKLGTVRSRIHRGRTMLRESLAHRAPGRAGDAPATAGRKAAKPRLKLPRIAGIH